MYIVTVRRIFSYLINNVVKQFKYKGYRIHMVLIAGFLLGQLVHIPWTDRKHAHRHIHIQYSSQASAIKKKLSLCLLGLGVDHPLMINTAMGI